MNCNNVYLEVWGSATWFTSVLFSTFYYLLPKDNYECIRWNFTVPRFIPLYIVISISHLFGETIIWMIISAYTTSCLFLFIIISAQFRNLKMLLAAESTVDKTWQYCNYVLLLFANYIFVSLFSWAKRAMP